MNLELNKNSTIWYISKYAVTPHYGNPTRQYFISQSLAAKGYDVTLISSQSAKLSHFEQQKFITNEIKENRLQMLLIKGPRINYGFSVLRIWSWILFEYRLLKTTFYNLSMPPPHVVIISSLSIITFISGVLLKWKYKSKLILEVRDIWPLSLIQIGGYSRFNIFVLILGLIERIGYKNANAIIGTMPNLAEHVNNDLGIRTPVFWLPQGFDTSSKQILPDTCDDVFPRLDNRKFNACYSGTIGLSNNIDLILTAAEMLEGDNIHFYIIGDGPLRDFYIRKAAKLKNIFFIRSCNQHMLENVLSSFDLLLLPVRNYDIYRFGISPNKVIDYMRSGRPILFSYGGFQSYLNSDIYSFNVPPENPVLFCNKLKEIAIMDSSTLTHMGKLAKEKVNALNSYDSLTKNLINIIERNENIHYY